ncbi:hypothetical protein GJ744_002652 [Endocarpon pusillum]|uniref:Uncharacterized protein n=1 Tax=Endocarpon pusillum TaxID=364733 RepID=A0A8H7A9Y1_9EURO|nr:hypothetical protein GJ744_002652 [Endocarpon pusillum]
MAESTGTLWAIIIYSDDDTIPLQLSSRASKRKFVAGYCSSGEKLTGDKYHLETETWGVRLRSFHRSSNKKMYANKHSVAFHDMVEGIHQLHSQESDHRGRKVECSVFSNRLPLMPSIGRNR